MNTVIKKIRELNIGRVEEDVLLKKYTTYRVGGPCSYYITPSSINNLILLLVA